MLTDGEETTPLRTAALPSGGVSAEELQEELPDVGEPFGASYCIECYEERCEALGIEPEEYSDDEVDISEEIPDNINLI